ncbi:MAG: hypothetical protein NZM42_14935 [Gemmatales bacterium]|nr:hypothetical protein [Gemmatales bacterium]MDW8224219.1 hypothetical protein [Gemmatales bacterium]
MRDQLWAVQTGSHPHRPVDTWVCDYFPRFGDLRPALVTTAERRRQTFLVLGEVALALKQYRLYHGHWPKKRGDLVPQFLPEVTRDLWDPLERPLRFVRPPDRVIIYAISLGFPPVDDGGDPERDTVLPLFDPDHRNRPRP